MEDTNIVLVRNWLISHPTSSLFGLAQELQMQQDMLEPLIIKAVQELGPQHYRAIYTVYANKVSIICTDSNVSDVEGFLGGKAKLYALQRKTEDIGNLYISEVLEKRKTISKINQNGGLFLNEFSKIGCYKQSVRELHAQHKLQFKPLPKPKVPEFNVKVEEKPIFMDEFEEDMAIGVKEHEKNVPFNKIIDIEIDDLDDIMTGEIESEVVESLPVKRSNPRENKGAYNKIKKEEELIVIEKKNKLEETPAIAIKKSSKAHNSEEIPAVAIKKSSKAHDTYLNNSPIVPKIGGKLKQAGLSSFFNKY